MAHTSSEHPASPCDLPATLALQSQWWNLTDCNLSLCRIQSNSGLKYLLEEYWMREIRHERHHRRLHLQRESESDKVRSSPMLSRLALSLDGTYLSGSLTGCA